MIFYHGVPLDCINHAARIIRGAHMKAQLFIIRTGFCFMIIMCALMMKNSYANDLGVMGETYTIMEADFLDFIQARIETMQKDGQWQHVQDRMQEDAIRYRDRPGKVNGITRTYETKSWKFDPSIVLDHDLSTHEGKLIAPAGSRVNPLQYMSLSRVLIFYDGDDPDQVRWVLEQDKKLKGHDKFILVNGSVQNQEKQINKPIYFDQAGTLTSRFGIRHVPATVLQDGLMLRITEMKP